jgi:hypothetical protein
LARRSSYVHGAALAAARVNIDTSKWLNVKVYLDRVA